MQQTTEELQLRIRELEKEIKRLHKAVKEQRYGLHWLDVPEAFEAESENKIPILEEVKEKAIVNNDGKPTHILIEGDNYHALTCLNYTHKGKIDVIYIDPPYNTGSDGFKYKDKRVLNEFPDGTPVPKDHPLRHSYWLSFMSKRLELAKNLLSNKGVIFISIDDNELAQLKMLCDQVFENEPTNIITVKSSETSGVKMSHTEKKLPKIKEYILVYSPKGIQTLFKPIKLSKVEDREKFKKYAKYYSKIILNPNDNPENWEITPLSKYFLENDMQLSEDDILDFKIENAERIIYRTNNKSFKDYAFNTPTAKLISATGIEYIWWEGKQMLFLFDYINESLCDLWSDISTINLNKEICELPSFSNGQKPLLLIQRVLELSSNKKSTVLDFFAGSGTTLHATLKINEEDGGSRQCILVQMNENDICEDLTYERNRRVMQGYTNLKGEEVNGLGNSLKYFRTSFVGKNNPSRANDTDKVELSHKAGYLLALSENTLNETATGTYYQMFENEHSAIAIYFQEDLSKIEEFIASVAQNGKHTSVYIFSWSNGEEFISLFDHLPHVAIKTIPQPILEIYRSINK